MIHNNQCLCGKLIAVKVTNKRSLCSGNVATTYSPTNRIYDGQRLKIKLQSTFRGKPETDARTSISHSLDDHDQLSACRRIDGFLPTNAHSGFLRSFDAWWFSASPATVVSYLTEDT